MEGGNNMIDFKEFRRLMDPDKIIELVKKATADTGKFGKAEQVVFFMMLLEEYHNWLTTLLSTSR